MNKYFNCCKLLLFCIFYIPNIVFAEESIKNKFNIDELNINIAKPFEIGNFHLTYFGLDIYYVQLFSDKNIFSYDNKLALVINYERKFTKDKLIQRSIEEIKKNNNIDDDLANFYKNELAKIFNDVNKGDRKTAYFDPKNGLKLYHNAKEMGQIKDLIFAKRFMDIWLHPKSTFPKMTKNLTKYNEN
jgi:hypothetical protein